MLSIEQQQQINTTRLAAYRAKLNPEQCREAQLAGQISNYGKKLGLNLIQISTTVRIGINTLLCGGDHETALAHGSNAAHILATTSAGEKQRFLPRRQLN